MPDRKPKPDRPTPRKEKLCKACKRPCHWTEQNSRDWDILKFCSDACSGHHAGEKDAALGSIKFNKIAKLILQSVVHDFSCAAKIPADLPRRY
jgi:hypothetical protein